MRKRIPTIALISILAALSGTVPAQADSVPLKPVIPVVILGGSAAAGWHDKTLQGYVERGLKSYANYAHVSYVFEQHAFGGAPVTNLMDAARYPGWLKETPGGIVVLAWGFLNDIRLHTPLDEILQAERTQIEEALASDHTVVVVSPPATEPTFTFDRLSEAFVWGQVAQMAKSFHNPAVTIIDVMRPMERYIEDNHQTYRPYMKGKWDPNTAGHILAGKIFAEQLEVKTLSRIGLLHRSPIIGLH